MFYVYHICVTHSSNIPRSVTNEAKGPASTRSCFIARNGYVNVRFLLASST